MEYNKFTFITKRYLDDLLLHSTYLDAGIINFKVATYYNTYT